MQAVDPRYLPVQTAASAQHSRGGSGGGGGGAGAVPASDDGVLLYIDRLTGHVKPDKPPLLDLGKGGFLCDAPGMGKTITALALMLWKIGACSTPPKDTAALLRAQLAGQQWAMLEAYDLGRETIRYCKRVNALLLDVQDAGRQHGHAYMHVSWDVFYDPVDRKRYAAWNQCSAFSFIEHPSTVAFVDPAVRSRYEQVRVQPAHTGPPSWLSGRCYNPVAPSC